MQLDKSKLKSNLINLLIENKRWNKDVLFKLIPVKENNVKYNSVDEFIELHVINEESTSRLFNINDLISILSGPHSTYPLWVNLKDSESENIINTEISLRFRKPIQLKNKELGFVPFRFEKR